MLHGDHVRCESREYKTTKMKSMNALATTMRSTVGIEFMQKCTQKETRQPVQVVQSVREIGYEVWHAS